MTKRSWLDIAEYLSVAGSVVGSGIALASQQVIYAAAPISLSLILNIANRRRLEQHAPAAGSTITEVNDKLSREIANLRDRVQGLPTDSELNFVQSSVAKHSETLSDLQRDVERTQSLAQGLELSPLRQDIALLREHYAGLQETVSGVTTRLDTVEQRDRVAGTSQPGVERLESAIAQINSKIAQFQNKLSKVDSGSVQSPDLTPVLSEIEQLKQRVDTVQETASHAIDQQIQEWNAQLTDLRSDRENWASVPQEVTALVASIDRLQQQQRHLEQAVTPVSELSRKVEELTRHVDRQANIEQVEQLKMALATAIALIPELEERLGADTLALRAGSLSAAAVDLSGVEESLGKIAESVAEAIAEMEQRLAPIEGINLNRIQQDLSVQTSELARLTQGLAALEEEHARWHESLSELSEKIEHNMPSGISPAVVENLETAFVHLQERVDALSELPYPELHEQLEQLTYRVNNLPVAIASVDDIEELKLALSGVTDNLTQLSQNTENLATKTEVRQKIGELENLVADLNESINRTITEDNRQLAEDVQTLREHLQFQSNGVPATLTHAVTSQIDELIEQFNARPEVEEIEQLRESVRDLYERLEQVSAATQSTEVDGEREMLDALRQEVSDLHSALARVSDSLTNLSNVTPDRIEAIERELGQLETELQQFADRIPAGSVQPQIEQLTHQLRAIANHPETAAIASQKGDLRGVIAPAIQKQVSEIHELLQNIQAYDYELVFDRPAIRALVEEGIASAQNRLIVVCPWVSTASLDGTVLEKLEGLLERGAQIDIGWGHLRDIEAGEFPIRINDRWQSDPMVKRGLYDALNDLEQLKKKYPDRLRLKVLGTHENFIVCDESWAAIASHHFLSTSDTLPEREVGLRTTDPQIIQGLIARFNEPMLNPGNASAYYNRGFERLDIGDYQGAAEDYSNALEMDSNQPTAYNNRGLAKFHAGDLEGAIADYTRSLELNPKEPVVYFNRGFARFNHGDYEAAIEDYTETIKLAPEQTGAYFYRGEAYGHLGDYQKALQDYTRAIELNPQDAVAYNNRGLARFNQADYSGAIEDYTEALSLKPEDAVAFSNRGVAKSACADYAGAIDDFNQSLSINPDYAGAYNNRGLARAEIGDRQGAIADLQMAAELFARQGNTVNHQQAIDTLNKLVTNGD